MKVLFALVDNPLVGGHNVQAHKTAEALRELGVDVIVSSEAEPDLRGVDVLHSFGVDLSACRRARRRGVPVVLSPIYGRLSFTEGYERPMSGRAWYHRGRLGAVMGVRSLRGELHDAAARLVASRIEQAMLYEAADLLLPNSEAEGADIVRDLAVSTPWRVVPNAVDPEIFALPTEPVTRDGVLYVGRIEPHKNQLGLLEAMAGTQVPITLVGPPHRDHQEYFELVRSKAFETGARVVGPMQGAELASLYQRYRVHCLPSWFETTGLVSLEAALCGCAVVTTGRGHARSYLGAEAQYCDPAKGSSIRAAIARALEVGASETLRARVLEQFTWAVTAERTLAAYEWLVEGRDSRAGETD